MGIDRVAEQKNTNEASICLILEGLSNWNRDRQAKYCNRFALNLLHPKGLVIVQLFGQGFPK